MTFGQKIDYSDERLRRCARHLDRCDGFQDRLDLVKVDVEGMELEVLEGGQRQSIGRHHPIHDHRGPSRPIEQALPLSVLADHGYRIYVFGINLIAIHANDPTIEIVRERKLGTT